MSTNPSYKPSEGKREEFRKYLEKNGVMDALTKVLVNLYEEVEKPEDALEYIRDKLSSLAGLETHKQLQQRLVEADDKIKDLEAQLGSAVADGEGGESVEPQMQEQTEIGGSVEEVAPATEAPVEVEPENPEQ